MKTFKQYFTEDAEYRHKFEDLNDLVYAALEMIGDAGNYEDNLRPSAAVGKGVEYIKEIVEDYLFGLGLTDTDAAWYEKRFEAYQAIWDAEVESEKDVQFNDPEDMDSEEKEDFDMLNQRFRAMIVAAMNNVEWEDYAADYSDTLQSTKRQGDAWRAAEDFRNDWRNKL
jgi:hypothetical protein